MRIGLVGLVLVVGCGSTGPSDDNVPALGEYRILASYTVPNPVGGPPLVGEIDGVIRVTSASAEAVGVEGVSGDTPAGAQVTSIGWNVDAYAVHIKLFGSTANTGQFRFGPRFSTCSLTVRHVSGEVYQQTGCTITRP